MLGPVFTREAVTLPRRPRHFLVRALYVTVLLLLMCTAWLLVAGTQIMLNVGDMARFGAILFQILAPLQLAFVVFFAAIGSASTVCQEKDRRTLILLLLTRMSNTELVLGKLMASSLNVLVMVSAAIPVFMLVTLFGGVSFGQVARVFAITFASALAAASLGSTLALWREKTFQALSMTALVLVMWLGVWEAVAAELGDVRLLGLTGHAWATVFSPFRAILVAASPTVDRGITWELLTSNVTWSVAAALGATLLLNLVAISRVRVWNPSRDVLPGQSEQDESASIWGADFDLAAGRRTGHGRTCAAGTRGCSIETPDGSQPPCVGQPCPVAKICTWAYGRKVLIIRAVYLLLFVMAGLALHWTVRAERMAGPRDEFAAVVPAAAKPLVPFLFVSLVIANALAVTSVTNERDGQALDLLLVTDLSPKEFVLGKLGGVFWVTKEMVVLPMALCVYLWWSHVIDMEDLCFLILGLVVMNVFVTTLGVHCGMTYANSRSAISVSLGTVFFLFLGILTCMVMMISFRGSFHTQLPSFLAFMLGGGVGLYVALGIRNPSSAMALASLSLPFATFFAITSFLLRNQELTVFLVVTVAYGFTAAAMLVPAVCEFDIAMGRTSAAEED